MTRRMLPAIENPHTDILGHCTGRIVVGRGRPPSSFDPSAVFEACARTGTAVEINSRPERRDPPQELLEAGARRRLRGLDRHRRTRPRPARVADARLRAGGGRRTRDRRRPRRQLLAGGAAPPVDCVARGVRRSSAAACS